jgi:hypothetical protein
MGERHLKCRSTSSVAGLSPPVPDSSVETHPRPNKYCLLSFPKTSGKAVVGQFESNGGLRYRIGAL